MKVIKVTATLSQEEKDNIISTLDEEQQQFLRNSPVDAKLGEIEQLLDEWVLVDFIDSGFVSEDTL